MNRLFSLAVLLYAAQAILAQNCSTDAGRRQWIVDNVEFGCLTALQTLEMAKPVTLALANSVKIVSVLIIWGKAQPYNLIFNFAGVHRKVRRRICGVSSEH